MTGHPPTEPFVELKPESQQNFELGLDMRMFDGRVGLDLTYYQIDNKDQFIKLPAPASSRYTQFYVNAGHIQNKGIEATLNLIPIKTSDLTWNSTFNFSSNKNTIIELHEKLPSGRISYTQAAGYASFIEKGGSFGDLYAYVIEKDASGNTVLDSDGLPKKSSDYQKIGNTNPTWTLSWNNSIDYGKWSFNFLLDGKFNFEVISLTEMYLDNFGVSEASASARDNGGVIIPGTNKKVDAKAYYGKVGGNNGIAGEYVYDGTNIRLRQASLAYNFDLDKSFIKSATVSVVGNNLFFLLKKAPHDPDLTMSISNQMQGVEFFTLPSTRSIGLNVKLTF